MLGIISGSFVGFALAYHLGHLLHVELSGKVLSAEVSIAMIGLILGFLVANYIEPRANKPSTGDAPLTGLTE